MLSKHSLACPVPRTTIAKVEVLSKEMAYVSDCLQYYFWNESWRDINITNESRI